MADTVVKVPKNKKADYDYIAFSFNDLHSLEDFGIYRTSDSNEGYSDGLFPTLTDKTANIPGMDGEYFFGTQHKQKIFNIKFAFDSLTEEKLQKMKKWLNGKEPENLWFAEAPHKVYTAKVTGSSMITSIAFHQENGSRVYKGQGSVQFTCYNPYARTPDYVLDSNGQYLAGNHYTSYVEFSNYEEIKNTLPHSIYTVNEVEYPTEFAYGDLPFSFIANLGTLNGDENVVNRVEKIIRTSSHAGTTYTFVGATDGHQIEESSEGGNTVIIGGTDNTNE